MIYPKFIEFSDLKPSCNNKIFTANTVHLKPYSEENYSIKLPDQFTDINDAYLVDNKGIRRNFTAELSFIKNKPYLYINEIQYDSWDNVYLKVLSSHGTLYSSLFRVSSIDINKTTYVKFKDNEWDKFGGVRLCTNYWYTKPANEITTYYQVTKERTISVGSKRQHIKAFRVENTSIVTLTALCDVLTYPIVYFNSVRTSAYEMPDIEGLTADEDFIDLVLLVTQDERDITDNDTNLELNVLGNRHLDEIVSDGDDNIIATNN